MKNISPFRRRVLEVLARHENEGTIEVGLEIYGYPTALEMHNVDRAFYWLCDHGLVDRGGPTITEAGRQLLAPPPPVDIVTAFLSGLNGLMAKHLK